VNGTVNNLGGTIMPGSSPGDLTINGDYTQGSAGILALELGGTTPGAQYDQLVVNGNATLGGTLQVSLVNSFLPATNDTFNVVQTSGTLTGTFSGTNPSPAPFTTAYLPSNVNLIWTLGALPTVPTAPLPNYTLPNNYTPQGQVNSPFGDVFQPLTGLYQNMETGESVKVSDVSELKPGTYYSKDDNKVVVVQTTTTAGTRKAGVASVVCN